MAGIARHRRPPITGRRLLREPRLNPATPGELRLNLRRRAQLAWPAIGRSEVCSQPIDAKGRRDRRAASPNGHGSTKIHQRGRLTSVKTQTRGWRYRSGPVESEAIRTDWGAVSEFRLRRRICADSRRPIAEHRKGIPCEQARCPRRRESPIIRRARNRLMDPHLPMIDMPRQTIDHPGSGRH